MAPMLKSRNPDVELMGVSNRKLLGAILLSGDLAAAFWAFQQALIRRLRSSPVRAHGSSPLKRLRAAQQIMCHVIFFRAQAD